MSGEVLSSPRAADNVFAVFVTDYATGYDGWIEKRAARDTLCEEYDRVREEVGEEEKKGREDGGHRRRGSFGELTRGICGSIIVNSSVYRLLLSGVEYM